MSEEGTSGAGGDRIAVWFVGCAAPCSDVEVGSCGVADAISVETGLEKDEASAALSFSVAAYDCQAINAPIPSKAAKKIYTRVEDAA